MLKILSKDVDAFGTDKYRDDNVAIPMAYRSSAVHSINPNSTSTNNQVTLKTTTPVVNVVNGVSTSNDSFMMVTKFSSLQHIVNDAERALCYDNHIKMLILTRDTNLAGNLPNAAVAIPSTGTAKIA